MQNINNYGAYQNNNSNLDDLVYKRASIGFHNYILHIEDMCPLYDVQKRMHLGKSGGWIYDRK